MTYLLRLSIFAQHFTPARLETLTLTRARLAESSKEESPLVEFIIRESRSPGLALFYRSLAYYMIDIHRDRNPLILFYTLEAVDFLLAIEIPTHQVLTRLTAPSPS